MPRIVLASRSPRRCELLAAAGFAFDVDPVDIDERLRPGERAAAYVERLAREKALASAARQPERVVIGADTAVVVGEEIFGKPAGPEDAGRMLRRLSGRSHEVLTGVAVVRGRAVQASVERTVVWMSEWPEAEIVRYVESGEPLDKAGAYAIQGYASRFIPRIEGSYANVVGLPVATLVGLLKGQRAVGKGQRAKGKGQR